MKTYLLNSITEKKPIGEILFDEPTKSLEIKLDEPYLVKYSRGFERLIKNIIEEGNFENIKDEDLKFTGVNKIFTQALIETCITNLNILPELK